MGRAPRLKKKVLSRAATAIAHADAEADEISPFREAIEFHKQKLNIPTQAWTDIMHEAHDRAFVVAGAMKEALLEDIHQAMIEGLEGKLSFDDWLERFDDIVARHGWSYRGGRTWRARVIYETNLRTARAAGRFKQMRHPDTLAAFPIWRYVHAFTRVPNEPRPEHESWDGLVLPATDPWWETYYPPNGWRCSCGVEPITEAEMRRTKGQPDTAPEIRYRKVKDPHTGEMVDYPDGVDFGWAYAPGRTWALGVVPALVDPPLKRHVWNWAGLLRKPDNLPLLESVGKPFPAHIKEMPSDLAPEDYVLAFLREFDPQATIDTEIRWRDAAGHDIVISQRLFQDAAGNWKVMKRDRWRYVLFLAAALKDPDEIWLSIDPAAVRAFEPHADKMQVGGRAVLDRRYLRYDPALGAIVVFEWNYRFWWGETAYQPQKRNKKPDLKRLEKMRRGQLLYRRQ